MPIRERVFTYLKNAILEGEYQAGDRLIERELAEKLNISRTPIREALLRLESLGFVKTLPRKGVVVTKITYEDVLEVFTILTSLEVLAVKLAAQKMDEETASELDQMIEHINGVLAGEIETEISIFHIEHNDALYKA
ncbi:GntR family transcriptional regulator, partial [Proteus mirabilis]|uniref:GntR family transcriptional regulator n=1 Tax=Proteus mirabilis TaxID=584 RepID=UPI001C7E0CC1